MTSVALGPDVANAAKDAVRDTVADLSETRASSDGLPYRAAHRVYQGLNGKVTHDDAWKATQQAIREMIADGELIGPTDHCDSWKLGSNSNA
jgi:hypothetical protein